MTVKSFHQRETFRMNNGETREIECVLRSNDELALVQYPCRAATRKLAPSRISTKPENGILKMVEELENSGPNFDRQRADDLARMVDGGNRDEYTEKKTFPSGRFDHLTHEGEKLSDNVS